MVLLSGCSADKNESYKITVSASPMEGGTTLTDKGSAQATYDSGANAKVTATAATGYAFAGWYENSALASAANPYTFLVEKDCRLEAKFNNIPYEIKVSASPAEGGAAVTDKGTASATYIYGTNARVTATAATGYTFAGWYENDGHTSAENPYTFKVEKARILEARFAQITYTVTATAATGGTVTGSGTFAADSDVTVTATPSTGYTFEGWYKGGIKVSGLASYTFKATENVTLEAKFTETKYTVTDTAATGGTITGSGTFAAGADVTVTATPSTGYAFEGWYKEGTKVSDLAGYTFKATENVTLEARFTQTKYTVIATAYHIGGAVTTGSGTYVAGSEVTVTATPSTGYTFEGWYKGEIKVSSSTSYTFKVTENVTLVAKIIGKDYTITTTASTGGTVTGSRTYQLNNEACLTAIPQSGYIFVGWYENNNRVSASDFYCFRVDKDRALEARFESDPYQGSEWYIEIDGVKWATRYIDVPGTFTAKETDLGMFYQKDNYTSYYAWVNETLFFYNKGNWDVKTEQGPCPTGWRLPKADELRSLASDIRSRGKLEEIYSGIQRGEYLIVIEQVPMTERKLKLRCNGRIISGSYFKITRAVNLGGCNCAGGYCGYRVRLDSSGGPQNNIEVWDAAEGLNIRCVKK